MRLAQSSADGDVGIKTPVGSQDPPQTAVPQRLINGFMVLSTACTGLARLGTAAPHCS